MTKAKMSNHDYQSLKKFEDLFFEWYIPKYPTTPDKKPSEFLEDVEKTSLANAKKGMQMMVNDTVEQTNDWQPEQVAEADARFSEAGTFTLSELRRRFSKNFSRILEKGRIESEVEYYLVSGIVNDRGLDPSTPDIELLQKMMNEFENEHSKNKHQASGD